MAYRRTVSLRIALALASAATFVAAPASALPIVSATAPAQVATGGLFSVDIGLGLTDPGSADDVADLFAYQLGITFDPTILAATTVTEGSFLSSAGSTLFVFDPSFIDNTAGTISFIGATLAGFVPGATGAGPLFTVQFMALAAGISPISIALDPANGDGLFDSFLAPIEVGAIQNSSVSVGDQAQVPEPGTWLLLVTGLGAAALSRRIGVRRRGSC